MVPSTSGTQMAASLAVLVSTTKECQPFFIQVLPTPVSLWTAGHFSFVANMCICSVVDSGIILCNICDWFHDKSCYIAHGRRYILKTSPCTEVNASHGCIIIFSSNQEQKATLHTLRILLASMSNEPSQLSIYLLHSQCLQVSDCGTTRRQVLFQKVCFWFLGQIFATVLIRSAMISCLAMMYIACLPVHPIISGLVWSQFKLLQNAVQHFVICVMANLDRSLS